MKLARLGPKGQEKPVRIVDGRYYDLSAHLDDITGAALCPEGLARIEALDLESLREIDGKDRWGAPIAQLGKLIGIGLNYADHAEEAGMPVPEEPIVFMKATSAICGPNDPILIPRGSQKTDWEVELAVIIGREAKYVSETDAMDYVAGYTICNDISERAFQLERGGQWTKGKCHDNFAPLGPWFVSKDEIQDVQNLNLWLDVNGEAKQRGNTKTMIFGVAEIVSYLSQFMRLEPGDVITTGTPPGVGMGQNPPVYLKEGDKITLGIDQLGQQAQNCEQC